MHAISKVLFCFGVVAIVRTSAEELEPEEIKAADTTDRTPLESHVLAGFHGSADSDGNGKVSLEEIMEFSAKIRQDMMKKDTAEVFRSMDENKDGKVSLDELFGTEWESSHDDNDEEAAAFKALDKLKFKTADTDHDGFLTVKELQAFYYPEAHDSMLTLLTERAFKKKDMNHDGKLNANEFWGFEVFEKEGFVIPEEQNTEFLSLDKNEDGFLDVEELKPWEAGIWHTEEAMKNLIEVADIDDDDHVSMAELDAARERLAQTDSHTHFKEWAAHEAEEDEKKDDEEL